MITVKLEQLLWYEPAHHLSPSDQRSQPMVRREEGHGLCRCDPLIHCMLITQLQVRWVLDRTAIMHTYHFILGESITAIEVCRPEDKLDVHRQTKLFECFPPHRLHKAFP